MPAALPSFPHAAELPAPAPAHLRAAGALERGGGELVGRSVRLWDPLAQRHRVGRVPAYHAAAVS